MGESVFLLLGGNIGNVLLNFKNTLDFIEKRIGKIIRLSSVYRTEPWGFDTDQYFYNQSLEVQTKLSPKIILNEILNIESEFGRRRSAEGYNSRTLDIDILFFGGQVYDSAELTIPHPKLHLRKFVLIPLYEIAPGLRHPVFDKTVSQLLRECPDQLKVTRCNKL